MPVLLDKILVCVLRAVLPRTGDGAGDRRWRLPDRPVRLTCGLMEYSGVTWRQYPPTFPPAVFHSQHTAAGPASGYLWRIFLPRWRPLGGMSGSPDKLLETWQRS